MNNHAEKFLQHNFHDALLKEIRVCPASSRREQSSVVVTLFDYDQNKYIDIKFLKAGNISFVGDFDVLVDNAGFGNTSHTKAVSEPDKLMKAVNNSRKSWNISYDEGATSPIKKKSETIQEFTTYKILFFGATLQVIAKGCVIKRRKLQAVPAKP